MGSFTCTFFFSINRPCNTNNSSNDQLTLNLFWGEFQLKRDNRKLSIRLWPEWNGSNQATYLSPLTPDFDLHHYSAPSDDQVTVCCNHPCPSATLVVYCLLLSATFTFIFRLNMWLIFGHYNRPHQDVTFNLHVVKDLLDFSDTWEFGGCGDRMRTIIEVNFMGTLWTETWKWFKI